MNGAERLRMKVYEIRNVSGDGVYVTNSTNLASFSRLAAQFQNRGDTVGQKVAFDIIELRALDQGGNLRGRKVGLVEFLCTSQSGDEGSVHNILKPLSLQVTKILTDGGQ